MITQVIGFPANIDLDKGDTEIIYKVQNPDAFFTLTD